MQLGVRLRLSIQCSAGQGFCEAVAGCQINQVSAMSRWTACGLSVYHWPGPVHAGNGTMQIVIDERADDRQREALSLISSHPPRHHSV